MNSFLFLCLCFLAIQNYVATSSSYTVSYFNQKVDHYNYNKNDTFKQRIVISSKYLDAKNPPILFYCGNEGDIFTFVNNTGFMWELEDKLEAVLVFVEHRYYGQSFPERTSKNDYAYLSIEQALTDFATVIDSLKSTRNNLAKSAVIAFGGSYGGMLASWFRIKYPHLVEGAIAGSAPILQFLPDYDCLQFNKIVTKDYQGYSPSCSNAIHKTWPAIRRLAATKGGSEFLTKEFKLCNPINTTNDVDNLVNYFNGVIVNVAMVDYPNAADFLKPMPRYPMKEICKILKTDQLNDPDLVTMFRDAFYSIYMNYTGNYLKCVELNQESSDLDADGWDYQSCTETIMPICSNGLDDFFEPDDFNVTEIRNECRKKYNVEVDEFKVRMEYGLRDLRAATNVVFSNGERDPWSAGGVLVDNFEKFGLRKLKGNELNETIYNYFGSTDDKDLDNLIFTDGPIIINIPNACHHEDLRATGEYDPKILLTVRKQETKIIQKWIKSYYERFGN